MQIVCKKKMGGIFTHSFSSSNSRVFPPCAGRSPHSATRRDTSPSHTSTEQPCRICDVFCVNGKPRDATRRVRVWSQCVNSCISPPCSPTCAAALTTYITHVTQPNLSQGGSACAVSSPFEVHADQSRLGKLPQLPDNVGIFTRRTL